MVAIRKIATVRNNSLTVKGLRGFNDRKVACIILPFSSHRARSRNRSLLAKYAGSLSSGHGKTSQNIDELIYGR